jgi:hypothetical protein
MKVVVMIALLLLALAGALVELARGRRPVLLTQPA